MPSWMTCDGLGRKDEARAARDQMLDRLPNYILQNPDDSMMLYNCACLHSRLGEKQRALDLLRLAVSKGQLNFGWMKNDPDLAGLRDNLEFIAITTA